ncbi:MAG: hypothetical protein H6868_09335 [Rhodospirillales bacterium]|nr:hypothetical protein [Rhodospirillales bacterium]
MNISVNLRILAAAPLLFLAACGDGWDTKLYDGVPYTMERTAGNGLAYVRANMMPPRGPVVDEVSEPAAEPVVETPATELKTDLNSELYMEVTEEPEAAPEPEPVQKADDLFDSSLRK